MISEILGFQDSNVISCCQERNAWKMCKLDFFFLIFEKDMVPMPYILVASPVRLEGETSLPFHNGLAHPDTLICCVHGWSGRI